MFLDRSDAGKQLAYRLRKFQDSDAIILAIPRGGVPVAYEVAKELNLPLEIVLVKKLGHPLNKEYAIGAVGLNDRYIVPHQDVSQFYIDRETENVRNRLAFMKFKFMGDSLPSPLQNKIIIIIDDGIATGNTLLATLSILQNEHPAKIIIAAPVMSRTAAQKLRKKVDEVISVLTPSQFLGVGAFYSDFTQVSDEEVSSLLQNIRQYKTSS